jgi:hypothetical protein
VNVIKTISSLERGGSSLSCGAPSWWQSMAKEMVLTITYVERGSYEVGGAL